MADFVMLNPYVLINAVDYSANVQEVHITYEADPVENTAGSTAATATHTNLGGLKNWTMEFKLKQDFAAGGLDEKLFALVGGSTPLEVRPAQGARSTANPGWTGNGLLLGYSPLDASVGALATVTPKFIPHSSSPILLRQTS